jgi:hypothetical protein
MAYSALLALADEAAYRVHFKKEYCEKGSKTTLGGLVVKFRERHFDHAFFEAAGRKQGDKSVFSTTRAQRMNWVAEALMDPKADLHEGYDNKKKCACPNRRVSISNGNFVVVTEVEKNGEATFVTAFIATPTALAKIRSNPKWSGK